MFNLSGSEIIVILLLALVILGPEKLPDAMRKAGKTFAELKKLSTGFQDEVRKGFEEPVKEVKKTAAAVRSATKLPIDTTATTAATTTADTSDDKPRYNPTTDPPPEQPEGSSVAEPLPPEPTVVDSPSDGDQTADAEPAAIDVDDVVDTADEPVAEADRTT